MQEKRVEIPIKEIMLEVYSHTGLPTNFGLANKYAETLKHCDIAESLVQRSKEKIINELMIWYHEHKKSRFPNIKSYDW